MEKNEPGKAMDKMTDAQLSAALGRYQKRESLGMLLGILLVIAACVLAFVTQNLPLFAALFFVGVGLILLLALPAQKKKKALLQQQLGGFFKTELDRHFGPAPAAPELPIDRAYLENSGLILYSWDSCTVENFREGECQDLHFSAANVELTRMVEEKSGSDHENWMTRTETVFRGVIIRCKDVCDTGLDIIAADSLQEKKALTDPAAFRRRFSVRTTDGGEAQVTEELCALCRDFEKASAGHVRGLTVQNGDVSMALETNYVFAAIPSGFDVRDVSGMRQWFTATLTGMGTLLKLFKSSPALSSSAEKA